MMHLGFVATGGIRIRFPSAAGTLSVLAAIAAAALGPAPASAQPAQQREALYHCYLEGPLTDADARRLKRDITKVLEDHRDPRLGFVVFEIDSDGTSDGDPAVAIDIADTIAGLKGITTVAYVRRAANSAVLIALACKHLVIQESGSLGNAPGKSEIPEENHERAESALDTYYHGGVKREYPVDLAKALIGVDHDELFLVPRKIAGARSDELTYQVLTATLLEEMDAREKLKFKPGAKELIARRNQAIYLTAKEALKYELCEHIVTDFEDVLVKLRFNVAKEDTFDQKLGGHSEKPRSPGSQGLIDFLNHHIVRFILLVTAFLCLMLEFKMPGTFIPGAISMGCFLIFFLAGFFPVTGAPEAATNVFELFLFFVGIALIAAEIFLAPGVMVFGLIGITVVIISIVMAMVAPSAPLESGAYRSARDAFFDLVLSMAMALGFFLVLVRFLPKASAQSGLVTRAAIRGLPTHDNVLESQEETAALVGLRGSAITPLRPSGKIDVDGRVLDVVAEGDFIEMGAEVEIVEATAFRSVVRRV